MQSQSISPDRRMRFRARGFTAIELMVVVSILAILAALAAPSFTPLIERWRVRQAVEGLESSLRLARREALKHGGNVVVQRIPNNTDGCTTAVTNGDWDCGWVVCLDVDANGSCAATEPVLNRFSAPPRLQITLGGGHNQIRLNQWGSVSGSFPSFTLVPLDKSPSDPAARGLCMSSAGRIRTVPPADIPCSG